MRNTTNCITNGNDFGFGTSQIRAAVTVAAWHPAAKHLASTSPLADRLRGLKRYMKRAMAIAIEVSERVSSAVSSQSRQPVRLMSPTSASLRSAS